MRDSVDKQSKLKNPRRLMSKVKTRKDGSKYRIVPKVVYFEGNPFEIERELDVDSDETASVDTSDDDFEVDQDGVIS